MNLLLDTCALLALASDRLSARARRALLSAPRALLSPVVPWELGIKVKTGKLYLPDSPLDWMHSMTRQHDLIPPAVGLDAALLCAAADLPLIHRDPFDRVLIATALRDKLTILTSDTTIPTYPGIKAIW